MQERQPLQPIAEPQRKLSLQPKPPRKASSSLPPLLLYLAYGEQMKRRKTKGFALIVVSCF